MLQNRTFYLHPRHLPLFPLPLPHLLRVLPPSQPSPERPAQRHQPKIFLIFFRLYESIPSEVPIMLLRLFHHIQDVQRGIVR